MPSVWVCAMYANTNLRRHIAHHDFGALNSSLSCLTKKKIVLYHDSVTIKFESLSYLYILYKFFSHDSFNY